jgi:hypothetical protein
MSDLNFTGTPSDSAASPVLVSAGGEIIATPFPTEYIAAIAGGAGGLLLLFAILIGVCICRRRRRAEDNATVPFPPNLSARSDSSSNYGLITTSASPYSYGEMESVRDASIRQ